MICSKTCLKLLRQSLVTAESLAVFGILAYLRFLAYRFFFVSDNILYFILCRTTSNLKKIKKNII